MSLNPVTPEFLDKLRKFVSPSAFVKTDPKYLTDPRGISRGHAGVVLAPNNVNEVSTILRMANDAYVSVIPFSGGTGLVGGHLSDQVPLPIVLSSERLAQIRSIHAEENIAVVEAGVILADLRAAVDAQERYFPLMLASEGSARLGGNLATNAGGMNVLRYGNTRDLCLGVEAVLADGTILKDLKRLRKDNTGYNISDLLIGSEGTLGYITAATLKLVARTDQNITALLVVDSPQAALELLTLSGHIAGDSVSIFELISQTGMEFVRECFSEARIPFETIPPWTVLIEIGTPAGIDATQLVETLMKAAMADGLVSDGVIAQSEGQRQEMLNLRELIPAGNKQIGSVSSHDISLPLSAIAEFTVKAERLVRAIAPFRINCFGHLGDGNLHYNVFAPPGEQRGDWIQRRREVAKTVYDLVAAYGGSFSAEHGVGRLKVNELRKYGDPGQLDAMEKLKQTLDPHGIMNPGAIFGLSQPTEIGAD